MSKRLKRAIRTGSIAVLGLALAGADLAQADPLDPNDYTSLGALPTGSLVIDTDALTVGGSPGGVVASQAGGGPDIAVFTFDGGSILESGATISVAGTRPLTLLFQGSATIAGTIDISGQAGSGLSAGPGGPGGWAGGIGGAAWNVHPASGGGLGGGPAADPRGGGGGAFGGNGQGGGGWYGAPPIAVRYSALRTRLEGGSGGGGGWAVHPFQGGGGGGGGGGIEIGARTNLFVEAGAIIRANGGAGSNGQLDGNGNITGRGGGGGAGGGIFLHGYNITLDGGTLFQTVGGGAAQSGPSGGGGGGHIAILSNTAGNFNNYGATVNVGNGIFEAVTDPAIGEPPPPPVSLPLDPSDYISLGSLPAGNFTIDTDAMTIGGVPGGVVVDQYTIPNIAVFTFDDGSILESGATISVVGRRPLALLFKGGATLSGTIDLSGQDGGDSQGAQNGSGGSGGGGGGYGGGYGGLNFNGQIGFGPGGGGGGQSGSGSSAGGGGGAFGGNGGRGDFGYFGFTGGGLRYSDLRNYIVGGSAGGGGGCNCIGGLGPVPGGGGGGGGGSIEIGALTNLDVVGGVVITDGGNGGNGSGGSGGGGAGGGVFLHGFNVSFDAGSALRSTGGDGGSSGMIGGCGGGGHIAVLTNTSGSFANNGTVDISSGLSGGQGCSGPGPFAGIFEAVTDPNVGQAPPDLSIVDVVVDENSGTANFAVALSALSGQTVTVDFATAGGTAIEGTDYTGATGQLTFLPGETSQSIAVSVIDDGIDELDESFTVTLSNPVNAILADAQATGTIQDDDAAPALSVDDVIVTEGNSGTVNAVFTVSLSAVSGQTVSVDFATADGTALAGSDYASASGTLSFAPGTTSQQLTVVINGDALNEADETFTVALANPENAVLADAQATGTITNDDAVPTVSIADAAAAEGAGSVSLAVSLSSPSGQDVSVDFATADGTALAGSDYTATSGTLTIPAGQTSASISVSVVDDALNETDETFTVALSNPVNATLADAQATGTITNDDPVPALSIADVIGVEGSGSVSFAVSLSAASGQDVSVDFATADGTALASSDYTATSGTLTIPAGQTSGSIAVAVLDDALNETDETFAVALSNPVNATLADAQATGTIQDDDAAPALSIDDVSVTEGNSGTSNAVFTVSLSAASGQTVSVDFATADVTALAGSDYASASGTLSFAPGTTSQQVTVVVNGDGLNEVDETFTVTLSNSVNATLADAQATGTITNDDAAPALSIADATGAEGAGSVSLAVSLSAASGQAVTVDFATADGTALAGSDYTATSSTLTIAAGQTTGSISVSVIDDVLNEADETFTVALSNPVNATLADGQATGTITNDDAVPALSIADVIRVESTGSVSFAVSLSAASGQDVSVDFETADGTALAGGDYTATSGTLTIPAGQTSGSIAVSVLDDALDEVDEAFAVTLSNPVNATLADAQATGTIQDDDAAPALSIDDVSVTEGNSGTSNAVFTVSLSAASGQTVSVDFATADGTALAGSDYVAGSGTLTFAPGSTSQPVAVVINGDVLSETNETFAVALSNPVNAVLADAQATGTIANDDAVPALSIGDVTIAEGNSGTSNAVFTVNLSAASGQTVTVDFATADGTATVAGNDYAAGSGTLNFAPGETSQSVMVVVNGDALHELDEGLFVNLNTPTNATLADAQATGTITNDDAAPGVSIGDASVAEGAGSIALVVTLSAVSGLDVSVDFATADGTALAGSDYTAASGTLAIAAGQTTGSIPVSVVNDALDEADETFTVTLSNPVSASLADAQATGTIQDDDAAPALSIADVSVLESDAGTSNAVFTVTLSVASGQGVSVDFATADGTATVADNDYVAGSGTLSFAPGSTSQSVTVVINGDTADEADESFFVNLSDPANATLADAQGQGTITNDDAQDNQPPDCANAQPSIAEIWPPNHKMVDITILGVSDPDGDPVTITITQITQDEPLDDVGDGNFEPDGAGVGTETAQVRAERMGGQGKKKGKGKKKGGPGNGRVYVISFVADDARGGQCPGSVAVCVPHDQSPSSACIDDGQSYDSVSGEIIGPVAKPVYVVEVPNTGLGNFPNPFNPSTTIHYTLDEASPVRLVIYNLKGQQVEVLVDEFQTAGAYRVEWNGRDGFGRRPAAGLYFFRLQTPAHTTVHKMILAK